MDRDEIITVQLTAGEVQAIRHAYYIEEGAQAAGPDSDALLRSAYDKLKTACDDRIQELDDEDRRLMISQGLLPRDWR